MSSSQPICVTDDELISIPSDTELMDTEDDMLNDLDELDEEDDDFNPPPQVDEEPEEEPPLVTDEDSEEIQELDERKCLSCLFVLTCVFFQSLPSAVDSSIMLDYGIGSDLIVRIQILVFSLEVFI